MKFVPLIGVAFNVAAVLIFIGKLWGKFDTALKRLDTIETAVDEIETFLLDGMKPQIRRVVRQRKQHEVS